MAGAAANIVLIGDQMQLAQPVRGVHPGETGLSSLEYLLEGKATVAEDRGILLNETRRLHPALCTFISDAIYDGRLEAHPSTKKPLSCTQERRTFCAPVRGIVLRSRRA